MDLPKVTELTGEDIRVSFKFVLFAPQHAENPDGAPSVHVTSKNLHPLTYRAQIEPTMV